MPTITLSSLPGIAPNRTDFDGRAIEAENVDLSGGGIKQINAPSFVETGHVGEICFHKQKWFSGDENYIDTDVNSVPALIYKNVNGWRININELGECDLWIDKPTQVVVESGELPIPDAPIVEASGTGQIATGNYEYFFSYAEVDSDGNVERESVKSSAVPVTVTGGGVQFTRGSISNVDSSLKLMIYRRLEGETYARFVEAVNLQQAIHQDFKATKDLGASVIPEVTEATTRQYQYVVSWVRYFGGWQHESIPSDPIGIVQDGEGVTIRLEEDFPSGVVGWRIYRISLTNTEATSAFQLVADLDTSFTEYHDVKENVELGEALGSTYRTDNGNLVTAGIPDEDFEGMAGPFNGFYVGWVGRDLYLSEPGNPAWWPGSYVTQANYNIKAVLQYGPNICVVTEGGVQFGYGSHPDNFVLSQSEHGAGGTSRTSTARNFYLGYDGIYRITDNGAELFTTGFSAEYFEALDHSKCWMVIEKEKMILFHENGGLVFDIRSTQWSTLSEARHSFESIWCTGGEIYALRENTIVQVFGAEKANIDYTGANTFGQADFKRVESLRFNGSGQVRCILLDEYGEVLSESDLDLDSGVRFDKTIYTPAWSEVESIQYKISGKGEIRSIMFDLEAANTRK